MEDERKMKDDPSSLIPRPSPLIAHRRFVALDRDGTIIAERQYLSSPNEVELLPGAGAGLRAMREQGLGLIIVTNQSAVGRGYFDMARLEEIHDRLRGLLAAEGVTLDGIYVCPHAPRNNVAAASRCRPCWSRRHESWGSTPAIVLRLATSRPIWKWAGRWERPRCWSAPVTAPSMRPPGRLRPTILLTIWSRRRRNWPPQSECALTVLISTGPVIEPEARPLDSTRCRQW